MKKQSRKKIAKRGTAPKPSSHQARPCELCTATGGKILWRDAKCRVVLVKDPDYAGFCRVIWRSHVREMTDLSELDRRHCMRVVLAVEYAVRKIFNPDKINLASLGNMTPHVHWHVIPRFTRDAHFPNPIWGRRFSRKQSAVLKLPPRWHKLLAAEISKSLGRSAPSL
jgi:diadenosine tetraphosphate (Ap4A) HIT family hydrolase